MKSKNYTAILEFEVINPTNDMESVGEILSLSSGTIYVIPIDRKQNWVVDEVQESLKYKI